MNVPEPMMKMVLVVLRILITYVLEFCVKSMV